MGSTISRVTLHNIGIINALRIKQGSSVYVIKANDVIPRIIDCVGTDNAINITAPSTCPCCGSPTTFNNDILYCTSSDCEAQLAGKIELLASRESLNIEGLSSATIDKMISYVKQEVPTALNTYSFCLPFYFDYEDILKLEGFAPKSAKKLYENIQKAKDTELKRFIYAANIPLIGKSASEAIANTVGSLEELVNECNTGFKKIATIPDIGPRMINSLKLYAQQNFAALWEAGIRPRDAEKPVVKSTDEVLTFVITGSFDKPRKEIETMIKSSGNKVSGSVSKKTSYLLASPGEEGTTKYKKAVELGTTIIHTLEELEGLLC